MTVYFVAGGDLVKIGFTEAETADDRLSALQTGSPIKLKLLALVPGGRALERELHARFLPQRRHGEWFQSNDEIARLIAYAKRFGKIDGFEDWAAAPAKLALRAATETAKARVARADASLARLLRLTPEKQWAHALRFWEEAEAGSLFRASESDCVTLLPGHEVPSRVTGIGVAWIGRGEGGLVSDKKGVHQTAAAIAELVRVKARAEHFVALWLLAALRQCALANIAAPGDGMLRDGAGWFLGAENDVWHWAAKAFLPEPFEPDRCFQSASEFVTAVYRLRVQTLRCTEIVDCRTERDGCLWYGNIGHPIRPLEGTPAKERVALTTDELLGCMVDDRQREALRGLLSEEANVPAHLRPLPAQEVA